jgi:hypothetical protein
VLVLFDTSSHQIFVLVVKRPALFLNPIVENGGNQNDYFELRSWTSCGVLFLRLLLELLMKCAGHVARMGEM